MKRLMTISAVLLSFSAFAQTDCSNPHDSNDDGAVTISDLLDLLSVFGDVDSDQDGIWDSVDACVDTDACNYAADPTESCAYIDVLGDCGGGCEGDGDGDGICDDEDDCVGVLDECDTINAVHNPAATPHDQITGQLRHGWHQPDPTFAAGLV